MISVGKQIEKVGSKEAIHRPSDKQTDRDDEDKVEPRGKRTSHQWDDKGRVNDPFSQPQLLVVFVGHHLIQDGRETKGNDVYKDWGKLLTMG